MKHRPVYNLDRFLPPGFQLRNLKALGLGLWLALNFYGISVFSFRFLSAWDEIHEDGIPRSGVRMRDFSALGGPEILKNFRIAATLLFFSGAALCYSHYFRGAKSHYLMRRLPDPMEWHWRALSVPLLFALALHLSGILLTFFTFLFYLLATPENCLPPTPWGMLWRTLRP